MICNMYNRAVTSFASVYHVCKITLVDLYVNTKSGAECRNLHIVAPSAALGHALKVAFEDAVDVGSRGSHGVRGISRIGTGILAFRIASSATAGLHINELLVIVAILFHVFNGLSADFVVLALVAIELVGESVEKTITC